MLRSKPTLSRMYDTESIHQLMSVHNYMIHTLGCANTRIS